ncbi:MULTISPECIES: GNAT family N-acetyltransferase [unclassified Streptomyces]|uniref:GNAT family N-acetyltransferase n=1 Tax=unclassified Streptomyces TaxID=2593676 RepID=UPI002E2EC1C0|nr:MULTISPECIES: GNAT family N-acetyltransferase [unclassified Streptomyces]WUC66665.1 GNAT family N-acetyltransferase [Streptomyces sp. NBC_00539]
MIEVYEVLPAGVAAQVGALEAVTWPGAGSGHDPALAPRTVVLWDGDGEGAGEGAGVVAACLTLLRKEIRFAGGTYRASGLSAVVTRPELRGRGLGGRLVRAARELLAADPEVDVALFSCDRELTPFYEAAGFAHLPGTVLLGGTPADPLPSDRPGFDKSVLAAFFTPDPAATRAVFTAARIPLYPGPVDRLW